MKSVVISDRIGRGAGKSWPSFLRHRKGSKGSRKGPRKRDRRASKGGGRKGRRLKAQGKKEEYFYQEGKKT